MPTTRVRAGRTTAVTPIATSSLKIGVPNASLPFPFNMIPSVSGLNLSDVAPGPLKPFAEGADFFASLTQSATWIRVGEFVAGGVLVYMGLRQFAKVFDIALPGVKDAVDIGKIAAL